MIKGMELSEVAKRIMSDRDHKKDYLADTRNIRVDVTAESVQPGPDSLSGKTTSRHSPVLRFKLEGKDHEFTPTRMCLDQIGDRVGIPRKYADKLIEQAPALLATNVNHWFQSNPERRMLRTLRNGSDVARAFLSDRYRPLDNADIAEKILPRLSDLGLEIKSCAVTEQRLYIQAVSPRITAEVPKVGDQVMAGVIISNSEVGCGSLNLRHLIYTLRCTNGMIAENIVKQNHVGRKGTGGFGDLFDNEEAQELYSDETRKLNDAAFWSKVQDVMKATLSKENFLNIVNRLNRTTEVEIDKPLDVVEVMTEKFGWAESEKESVLDHLIKGGDITQYGLLNAVTRAAQDLPSYDRAVEFEKMGGQIMLLPKTDFAMN
jgi:hypothetical protein